MSPTLTSVKVSVIVRDGEDSDAAYVALRDAIEAAVETFLAGRTDMYSPLVD